MKLIIILIIILIILFLPLPIKIKLEYLDKNLIIKLYKYPLFSSKNGVENKYLKKLMKKKPKIKTNKIKAKRKFTRKLSFKNLYRNFSKNKLKPKIKIKASISYGIDDAAISAMLYGLLCNIPFILYLFLSIIFKVKDLSFDIDPKFNSTLLTFGITSIFYFNIANIICILFLLFKSKENKEVAPNLGRKI